MSEAFITSDQLGELAVEIKRNLTESFPDVTTYRMATGQVLGVSEEAGEFVGAFRRWSGLARRPGTFEDMAEELADVIIMSWVASHYLGIDLPDTILRKAERIRTRGWRDPR